MLRHGGKDLDRLTKLRDERLVHQHNLQDAEQCAVAAADTELHARAIADTERARVHEISAEIDGLLDKMPPQREAP